LPHHFLRAKGHTLPLPFEKKMDANWLQSIQNYPEPSQIIFDILLSSSVMVMLLFDFV
jgi:hypothetical protein